MPGHCEQVPPAWAHYPAGLKPLPPSLCLSVYQNPSTALVSDSANENSSKRQLATNVLVGARGEGTKRLVKCGKSFIHLHLYVCGPCNVDALNSI